MKNRTIVTLLIITVFCMTFFALSSVTKMKKDNSSINTIKSLESMPFHLSIDSGNNSNKTGLNTSYKLNKDNGKYVSLYIENKGINDVVATINGNNKKTFKPGDKDNICIEVTQGFLGIDNEYVFKVLSGKNGGIVDICYEITQQNTQLHTDDDLEAS